MPLQITNRQARHLLLDLQGLTRKPAAPLPKEELRALIGKLGYLQLDSVNAVERAHHMMLFSRAEKYKREDLHALHESDKALFEHWTHDACLIPIEFYPYWHERFKAAQKKLKHGAWKTRLGPHGPKIIKNVKQRIEKEGPLMARDFEDKGAGGWWGWGPSKTALEFLWRTGDLAISKREGFQKVYDLAERVIPEGHRTHTPSAAEIRDWKCREALKRLGTATHGEIAAFWESLPPAEVKKWLAENARELCEVEITGADGTKRAAMAFKNIEGRLEEAPTPPTRLRFLSPFDPVLRDRKRAERIFGFDYRIEIFVPEKKRQYGYYVLPILEGARFTGRADMKVHRKEGVLEVKGLWLEPGVRWTGAREEAFRKALARLAKFSGAETIKTDDAIRRAIKLQDGRL
jgi:uncharacterized protein YcaQ